MTAWRMAFRAGSGGASFWPQCRQLGVAAITYSPFEKVDLSLLAKGEPKRKWRALSSTQSASLSRVAYEMKQGDVIYVKEGPSIVGRGVVCGPYFFDVDRRVHDSHGTAWCHQVPVNWEPSFPEIQIKLGAEPLTVKRLTDDEICRIESKAQRVSPVAVSSFSNGKSLGATSIDHRWWVYKCNTQGHVHQRATGDWEDLFSSRRAQRWGSTEWALGIRRMNVGDLVIAYQTDRNELVGVAQLVKMRSRGKYRDIYLRPAERINAKVRPLKEADPKIEAIPALGPGPMMTVREIDSGDAHRLLDAARASIFAGCKPFELDTNGVDDRQIAPGSCSNGAGFGRPENNAVVEKSAIQYVRKWYLREGWKVASCEREGCGFDLRCVRNRTEQNAEVKGVAGGNEAFIITEGEVNQARTNPRFVLWVVSNALSPQPTATRYSGAEFLRRFYLNPINYRAALKPSRE